MRQPDQPDERPGLGAAIPKPEKPAPAEAWLPISGHPGYERNSVTGEVRQVTLVLILP